MQAAAAVITALNEQVKVMEAKVSELFRRHPDAGIYLSQPGIGDITGARILGEFGDAPGRYATAKARKNYAGTSPLTIAVRQEDAPCTPGTSATGTSSTPCTPRRSPRSPHPPEPAPATTSCAPATSATTTRCAASPAASTGILHGCLKTGRDYDETTAWSHRATLPQAA